MPDHRAPANRKSKRVIAARGTPNFDRADAGSGKAVRCAIYTRKSTEEGLDQAFNSLDAQREACAAYILSQQHEGWTELQASYDDGGFSGGSMDRPGLAALLEDIQNGLIDTVVVYKVDRLTRSLTDFARIVEQFEGQGVSFVSVTQQFNTTTSMGRLTLNVLLSFAQFEREVTAERIRDKIAASKKKGMWMGGSVPVGYRVEDRKLLIDTEGAETVRHIFRLYLELGSVRDVKAACDQARITTPLRTSRSGRASGGTSFSRGHLYWVLRNPIYIGRVKHRGETYKGQHDAIIDNETWDAVQQQLNAMARFHVTKQVKPDTHLFRGRVFDGADKPLHATKTSKRGRHYFYYTSRCLMTPDGEDKAQGWRVPAKRFDATISRHLAETLGDPIRLAQLVATDGAFPDPVAAADHAAWIRSVLDKPGHDAARSLLEMLVDRICLLDDGVQIELYIDQLCMAHEPSIPFETATASSDMLETGTRSRTVTVRLPVQMERRSVDKRILIGDALDREDGPDLALVGLLAQAHRWHRMLGKAEAGSIREIANLENVEESEISRVIALSSLAPDIVEAVLDGRHPPTLTAYGLRRISRLPLEWSAQRRLLGFEA